MPYKWPFSPGSPCRLCGSPIEATRKDPVCRSCVAESAREYRARPEVRKRKIELHRIKTYGILPEEYNAMLEAQEGVCAICKQPETSERRGIVKTLALDHDHATNRRRGLLTQDCNTALGLLNDDPVLLMSAIEYLVVGEVNAQAV